MGSKFYQSNLLMSRYRLASTPGSLSACERSLGSRLGIDNTKLIVATKIVGHCLATKVVFRQIAGYVMGMDDHRVG